MAPAAFVNRVSLRSIFIMRLSARRFRRIDPVVPVDRIGTLAESMAESVSLPRFRSLLMTVFATAALLLAAVGTYGVIAYSVAQGTQEIGLRMALGAGRSRVLGEVLKEGMLTSLAGVVLGSAGAYFVGRAMQGLVYGVGAFDAPAFAVVVTMLLGSALLACLVPVRRAASVDPMTGLRQE